MKQVMEDSIIPSVQVTPVKVEERIPLKERIRGLLNSERTSGLKRRKRNWFDKIVGKTKKSIVGNRREL